MAAEKAKNKVEEMQGFWTDFAAQNVEKMTSMYDEWAKLEKKAIVQASNNIDEAAKLMKAGIDYMTEMNDQMRDITIETFKKAQKTS